MLPLTNPVLDSMCYMMKDVSKLPDMLQMICEPLSLCNGLFNAMKEESLSLYNCSYTFFTLIYIFLMKHHV